MTAINPNDLPKFIWILEVRTSGSTWAYTRLASVRDLTANVDTSANVVEVNADDTGTVLSGNRPVNSITCTLLENMSADVIELLLWGTNRTNTAATPVAVTWEALGTGWTVWTPIKLANKNGDNTIVTSITIDADATPLVAGTDYNTYVWDGLNGDLGYTYIVPVTAQAGVLDADYTYTPNAKESVEVESVFQSNTLLDVKITATSDGKDRILTLNPARLETSYWMSFLDVVEAGDLTWADLTFTWEKWATLKYDNEIL